MWIIFDGKILNPESGAVFMNRFHNYRILDIIYVRGDKEQIEQFNTEGELQIRWQQLIEMLINCPNTGRSWLIDPEDYEVFKESI
jgi:hypothetical protein